MLYDLNIPWSPSTNAAQLQRTLKFASSLGYGVVALNQTVVAPITAQPDNQIPLLTPPPASHPQPQQGGAPSGSTADDKLPTTLRRVTIVISDPKSNHRLTAFAAAYDVVAVRPTTERAFAECCTDMANISLISLDMTSHFPFHFHPRTSMAAVNRGVLFEICYGQALAASEAGDTRARSNFISNLMSLVRATKGRGLVLSSEARAALDLRAPADVVNLCAVWGLSAEKGTEALGVNPRSVVVNEGIRRRGFRGVIDVIRGAHGGPLAWNADGDGGKTEAKGKEKGKGKNPKGGKDTGGGHDAGRGEQSQKGLKRGNSEIETGSGEQALPISKRQAKKMRVASQKEARQKDTK